MALQYGSAQITYRSPLTSSIFAEAIQVGCGTFRTPWASVRSGAQPLLPQVLPLHWRLDRPHLERRLEDTYHDLQVPQQLPNRRALVTHEVRIFALQVLLF